MECSNSDSAYVSRATATGGAWDRRATSWKQLERVDQAQPFLPFLSSPEETCNNNRKRNKAVGFILFPSFSNLCLFLFSPFRIGFSLIVGPAVDSRSEVRLLLWAPLEEGLLLEAPIWSERAVDWQ